MKISRRQFVGATAAVAVAGALARARGVCAIRSACRWAFSCTRFVSRWRRTSMRRWLRVSAAGYHGGRGRRAAEEEREGDSRGAGQGRSATASARTIRLAIFSRASMRSSRSTRSLA